MAVGWLVIHRKLLDKPIWKGSTPEQKVVLMTLLMMVDFMPSEWEWQGETFRTKPGEKITSISSIVKNAGKGISTQNVRSSLKRFEKLQFLTNKSTKTGRLISIINWDSYQEVNKETNKEPTKAQQRPNKGPTPNEQGNKETREQTKEKPLFDPPESNDIEFDKFWNLYDKKSGRKKCEAKWKRLKVSDRAKIFETLPAYILSTPDPGFRKNPLTYMNGEHWNDIVPQNRTQGTGLVPCGQQNGPQRTNAPPQPRTYAQCQDAEQRAGGQRAKQLEEEIRQMEAEDGP